MTEAERAMIRTALVNEIVRLEDAGRKGVAAELEAATAKVVGVMNEGAKL